LRNIFTKRNIRHQGNIVNRIVNLLRVIKWGSHRRHLADHTKIVTIDIIKFKDYIYSESVTLLERKYKKFKEIK
jgi:hypothetical protein